MWVMIDVREINLELRYPDSRQEDITDAFMRGYTEALETSNKAIEKLHNENAKLREELRQWECLTANIELPEHPMTEFHPKDLERENAKLRKLNSLDRLREAMGCNTIRDDHNGGIIYQRVHLDKALFDKLCDDVEAEITKLRELVRIALEYCVNGYCGEEDECPLYESRHSCRLDAEARELGVEVDYA